MMATKQRVIATLLINVKQAYNSNCFFAKLMLALIIFMFVMTANTVGDNEDGLWHQHVSTDWGICICGHVSVHVSVSGDCITASVSGSGVWYEETVCSHGRPHIPEPTHWCGCPESKSGYTSCGCYYGEGGACPCESSSSSNDN